METKGRCRYFPRRRYPPNDDDKDMVCEDISYSRGSQDDFGHCEDAFDGHKILLGFVRCFRESRDDFVSYKIPLEVMRCF